MKERFGLLELKDGLGARCVVQVQGKSKCKCKVLLLLQSRSRVKIDCTVSILSFVERNWAIQSSPVQSRPGEFGRCRNRSRPVWLSPFSAERRRQGTNKTAQPGTRRGHLHETTQRERNQQINRTHKRLGRSLHLAPSPINHTQPSQPCPAVPPVASSSSSNSTYPTQKAHTRPQMRQISTTTHSLEPVSAATRLPPPPPPPPSPLTVMTFLSPATAMTALKRLSATNASEAGHANILHPSPPHPNDATSTLQPSAPQHSTLPPRPTLPLAPGPDS